MNAKEERARLVAALDDPRVRAVADAAAREEFGADVYGSLDGLIAAQDVRSIADGNQAGWRYVREARRFIEMLEAYRRSKSDAPPQP
jgi:hypothetical protein